MRDMRTTSMAQVAKVAGVSHQTVSRVINNFPGVREETRKRVKKAIRDTGYVPNTAARTLVTNRSSMVGVISVGSFLFGPTHTLAALEKEAREARYTTLLTTVSENSREEFFAAVNNFLQRSVDVIIVIAARHSTTEFVAELELDIPLITVGIEADVAEHIPGLCVDQDAGARMAIRHLHQLGHEHVGLINGPENWNDAQLRHDAALDEAQKLGMRIVNYSGDWSARSGFDTGMYIASLPVVERPTGLFSANDHMALGLFAAFAKCGISVPRDMSVIGFDNVPESGYYSPALSTISQDFDVLGFRVLKATLALVAGEEPDLTPVPPRLVIRESTARLRVE
ncbi:LacI family DNA-binding transcriptional regulator [Actinotignum urinale]|uniref:LacI family DNA-binding transcriptional regulator n=1 Tax=Actinotignum urinale TaxID=190146 RepID=UPI00370D146F